MNRVTLYIADMEEGFIARVRSLLSGSHSIEIVGSASDGRRAINDVQRLSPDVLLTDISLPELDGISLLRETRRFKHPPAVIVCTRFYSNASMVCACRLGASFFLCKPVDLSILPSMILECRRDEAAMPPDTARQTEADDSRQRLTRDIREKLKRLGMPSRLSGYAYILEAALICQSDELLLRNLSSGLYAHLARRMDTTVCRVERSLRSAIAVAYERGSLRDFFPQRPTNRQFIEFILHEPIDAGHDAGPVPRYDSSNNEILKNSGSLTNYVL